MRVDKTKILIDYALAHDGKITTKEANTLLERYYYCNAGHYVSEILTRLVKGGHFLRVKIGHYEINPNARPKFRGNVVENHPKLF